MSISGKKTTIKRANSKKGRAVAEWTMALIGIAVIGVFFMYYMRISRMISEAGHLEVRSVLMQH